MNFLSFLLAGYGLFGQPFVPSVVEGGDIGAQIDRVDLRDCCEKIMHEGPRIWFLGDRNGRMKLQVRGIYIHGSVLLFLLRLSNRSSRDYMIEGIRFQPANKDGGSLGVSPGGSLRSPLHGSLLGPLHGSLRETGDGSHASAVAGRSAVPGRAALEPIFIYDSAKVVPGYSNAASIFVLPRFTLPAGGRLWIEMRETNGGRLLRIPVSNWMLARARLI